MLRSRPGFAPFDIVLLDPPYDQAAATVLETLAGADSVLAADGLVVLEHSRAAARPGSRRAPRAHAAARVWDSALAFYQKQADGAENLTPESESDGRNGGGSVRFRFQTSGFRFQFSDCPYATVAIYPEPSIR
jgi:hypothetical protein